MNQMSILQKFLVSVAFLFVLLQLLFFIPEQVEVKDLPKADYSKNIPQQTMQGVRLFERKADKNDWKLVAKSAEAYQSSANWKLSDVQITFFAPNMEYYVESDEAEISTGNMDIRIYGNIRVKTSNDYEFQTDTLNYDSEDRHLDAPTRTLFVSPPDRFGKRMSLEADKIIASLDENQVQAVGNVVAEKQEKKSNVKIQSKEAVLHLDTQYSQFMDEVNIDYHTSDMKGPIASLKYDEERKTLTELVMTGGATLTDKNRLAVAQTMSIDFIKDMFLLSGNPRVIQDGDELIGKEILLLNGGKQIKVKGAKAQIEDLMGN